MKNENEQGSWVIPSPVGFLELVAGGKELARLEMGVKGPVRRDENSFLKRVEEELTLYFAGKLKVFTIPVKRPEISTPYANAIWDGMLKISYGETLTYGGLAKMAGGSPRSVGGACKANPVPIIIPCHRVVAVSGLGGYAGDWEKGKALSVKRYLLELEERNSG